MVTMELRHIEDFGEALDLGPEGQGVRRVGGILRIAYRGSVLNLPRLHDVVFSALLGIDEDGDQALFFTRWSSI